MHWGKGSESLEPSLSGKELYWRRPSAVRLPHICLVARIRDSQCLSPIVLPCGGFLRPSDSLKYRDTVSMTLTAASAIWYGPFNVSEAH